MPLKSLAPVQKQPTVHGAPCSIGKIYRDNLADVEEIDQLDSLLYEQRNTAREVWDELVRAGYQAKLSTVNKHRGGSCRCFTIDRDLWCLECHRDHARCACGDNV
jgi:hypothetical protein